MSFLDVDAALKKASGEEPPPELVCEETIISHDARHDRRQFWLVIVPSIIAFGVLAAYCFRWLGPILTVGLVLLGPAVLAILFYRSFRQ